jgi:hypothetical protein
MIPNNIVLTYKKKENVPSYVFENLKKLNPDKEVLFFSDEDVKKFLLEEYDSSYVDFFNSLRLGCTKGDFFRYCYLFKRGGYYCDVDIQHIEPISAYTVKDLEFFSVNAAIGPMIFQALLYCESEHEILKHCIEDIMNPETAKNPFYHTTEHMYKNVKRYLGLNNNIPTAVFSKKETGKNIQIAQEVQINGSYACLFGNRIIAMSRYPKYKREEGFKDI